MDLRILQPEKRQIYLLFYRPTRSDPFQNRLVAFLNGPFCHVELAFPDKHGEEPWEKTVWGSSIYQDESVFYEQKSYRREGYVSYAIEVSTEQLYKIKSFCKHHSKVQTPFSLPAMYAAYLPWQIITTDGTFCSKHVTHALQYGNVQIADNINASLTTPSSLFKILMKRKAVAAPILQVIPSRMGQNKKYYMPVSGNVTMMNGNAGCPNEGVNPFVIEDNEDDDCDEQQQQQQQKSLFSFLPIQSQAAGRNNHLTYAPIPSHPNHNPKYNNACASAKISTTKQKSSWFGNLWPSLVIYST